jgi:tyrosyl-tRNA synthetase
MRGRDLQDSLGQPPQIVMTVPLLLGLDGVEKMSKSLGNYVGFFEEPEVQFGKTMSISDDLMWEWYLLLTDSLPSDIEVFKQGHPMAAKKALARQIVLQFHGVEAAQEAEERWVRRFSNRTTEEAPSLMVPASGGDLPLTKLLVEHGLTESRKEAERLVKQGAVSLDGAKVSDPTLRMNLQAGDTVVVRVGRLKLQRWVIQ